MIRGLYDQKQNNKREKKKREKNMPLEDTIVVHGRESAKRRGRKGAVGGEHKGGTA